VCWESLIADPPSPDAPGEILLEEWLKPAKLTQLALSKWMGVDIQLVNGIVNGRRSVTAKTARLLAKVLTTSPEFWLNAQMAVDRWHAQAELKEARHLRRRSAQPDPVRLVLPRNPELRHQPGDGIAVPIQPLPRPTDTLLGSVNHEPRRSWIRRRSSGDLRTRGRASRCRGRQPPRQRAPAGALPPHVAGKYTTWIAIVREQGPEGLRAVKGFHDEKLGGDRSDFAHRV
jgi:antitoxin HigA-1